MDALNSSKIVVGLSSLFVGMGSKYLFGEASEKYDVVMKHPIVKQFIIFVIVFLSTRDLALSAGITMLIYTVFQLIINGSIGMALRTKPNFYIRPFHLFRMNLQSPTMPAWDRFEMQETNAETNVRAHNTRESTWGPLATPWVMQGSPGNPLATPRIMQGAPGLP